MLVDVIEIIKSGTYVSELEDKKEATPTSEDEQKNKEQLIKQLNQVICICKGINLARVLRGLDGSETVADVNQKVGTGSGGCQGERCRPKIKILLEKKKRKTKKAAQEK